MGILNTLVTFIVGVIVVGVAFIIIDVAKEVAPAPVAGTTSGVSESIRLLAPSVGIEDLGLGAIVLVGIGLFYGLIQIFRRQ